METRNRRYLLGEPRVTEIEVLEPHWLILDVEIRHVTVGVPNDYQLEMVGTREWGEGW